MTFTEDEPDLARTRFGARTASSVAVSQGCTVELFDRPSYHGRSTIFRANDNDLSNTPVGEDTVASLRVSCERHGEHREHADRGHGDRDHRRERGVRLFRDRDLKGPSEFFDRDVPDLGRTTIGNNQASSLDVTPGCVAILYEKRDYRGRSAEFRERDNNLKNTAVGGDSASSLQVRCK
jgi:hypothetical protein